MMPGAASLLSSHGIDLEDAAYKLSVRIPSIISKDFNSHASRNILAATMHDIAEGIELCVI